VVFGASVEGDEESALYLMDAEGGGRTKLIDEPVGGEMSPAWYPDGARIAFTRWPDAAASEGGDGVAIWAMNADGSDLERLTYGPGLADHAAWSPDGQHIAFSRYVTSKDAYAIFTMDPDVEEVRRIHAVTGAPYGVSSSSPSWSPDGSRIAFVRDENQNRPGDSNLYVIDPDGSDLQRVSEEAAPTTTRRGPRTIAASRSSEAIRYG
jgi:TolB protein